MEGTRKLLVDKVNEFTNSGGGGGGGGDLQPTKESIANFFQKILEYLLNPFDRVWGFFVQIFDGISWGWGSFVEKFDSIWGFLVEKWSLILPIALLLLLLSLCAYSRCFCFPSFLSGCSGCFRGFFRCCSGFLRGCFRGCYSCCGTVGRGTGKMMKAPGRMGVTMLRASFEANPLGYFRALHAGGPHLF